jgi:hypothetical protein
MGMDIYALNPNGKAPNYFRANIFGWSLLGGYIDQVAPTVETVGMAWWSNNGDPIDEETAERIAAEVRAHITEHGLPDTPNIEPNPTSNMAHAITSALIGDSTKVINMTPTNYVTERIEDFLDFLENSGGISIQ